MESSPVFSNQSFLEMPAKHLIIYLFPLVLEPALINLLGNAVSMVVDCTVISRFPSNDVDIQ